MKFKIVLPALMLTFGLAHADDAMTPEAIAERIAPVGQVHLEGAAPAAPVEQVATGPRSGEQVYNTACMACHTTGAAGAPKLGDAAAWGERNGKGLDMLVSNAINGINAMPPRGTCLDCSDDEIRAAVEYMLDNSQ